MTTPLVSVLVPCFNQARYLGEAMKSVRDQTFKSWEAIIVASDPDSAREARRHASESVLVIEHPATGVSDARNVAARAAAGRFLLPLDADDVLEKTYLDRTISRIGSAPLAIAYTVIGGSDGRKWAPTWHGTHIKQYNCLPYSALHTRELWSVSGGWDVSLIGFEDWAYWISCSRFTPTVAFVDESLLWHRRWEASRSTQLDQWAPVWKAMIRMTLPAMYPEPHVRRADRMLIASIGKGLLGPLHNRAKLFPDHALLKEWIGLAEGRIAP